MQFAPKVLLVGVFGTLLGSLLSVAAPPRPLTAQGGKCKCDDGGAGAYECSADQQKCKAGGEECFLNCK